MATELVMPRMGMTMTEGTIVRWLKSEGDEVKDGEPVVEILTDKAIVEVETPASGILAQILAYEDAVVPVGEAIAIVAAPGEIVKSGDQAEPAPKATPVAKRIAAEHGLDLAKIQGTGPGGTITKDDVLRAKPAAEAPRTRPGESGRMPASPAARRVAREFNVDLTTVEGTGARGQVTEGDVRRAAAARQAVPSMPPTAPAPMAVQPVRGSKKLTAERMAHSFQTAPHFYLTVEADARALVDLRARLLPQVDQQYGIRITVTDLLVKLVAAALRKHPLANAAWENGGIRTFDQVNIGVATAGGDGLVVPVIHQADVKTFGELAVAREALTARARDDKLTLNDVSGGTFTLSNLGMFGIDQFSAILNPPQSALLAVGRIRERPVAIGGQLVPRPTLYLTLSVDHRVLDGAQAAAFLQDLVSLIEQPALLVA